MARAEKGPQAFRFRWEQALRERGGETGLTLQAFAVVLIMATYANADGSRVFVSDVQMSQRVGCSRQTWLKWRRQGIDAGWISLLEHRPGRSDIYDLTIPERVNGTEQPTPGRALSTPLDSTCQPPVTARVNATGQHLSTTLDTTSTSTNTFTSTDDQHFKKRTGDEEVSPSDAPSFWDDDKDPRYSTKPLRVAGATALADLNPWRPGETSSPSHYTPGACRCVSGSEHEVMTKPAPSYPTNEHGRILLSLGSLGYQHDVAERFRREEDLRDEHGSPVVVNHRPAWYGPQHEQKDMARHMAMHTRTNTEENPLEAFESDPEMQHYIEMVQTSEIRDWQDVPPALQRWAAKYIEGRRPQ